MIPKRIKNALPEAGAACTLHASPQVIGRACTSPFRHVVAYEASDDKELRNPCAFGSSIPWTIARQFVEDLFWFHLAMSCFTHGTRKMFEF